MSDLYVKQSDLDVIGDKLKGYQKAIEQIEQSIEEFKQIVQDGEGEAINALKEITEKQGNINLEEYKERVNQLSKTFIEYNDEFFSNEVKPESRGQFTELDRNDIWANLMSIEWAEGHIQNGINDAGMPFVDNGKNKTVVDEAVARTNSFLATIKNLRGELWNQFKKIEHIDDTDKGYQSRIKNELGQFASFWDNLTAAFEQVGNFLNGVKDSIIGLVEGLVNLVKGLVCVILNVVGLGAGALYGAITGDWRLKDMCSDNLGKTFKVMETIANDPWLLVEGIGQQYNDGVNEKGVAYGVGMLVGDFLPELVGAGAVSVTGKIKYTKVITALEKVGVVVDVEKVIAKFGSESKFLKYVDEFGGEAKFTELVKNAGGIDELTRLVDEAGGVEKFVKLMEEAGGVARLIEVLDKVGDTSKLLKIIEQAGGAERFFKLVDEAGGVDNFTHAIKEFGDFKKVMQAIENPTTVNEIAQLNSNVSIVEPDFHTGRFKISSLNEQLALREMFSGNPLEGAKDITNRIKGGKLNDPRLPEPKGKWRKYAKSVNRGTMKYEVHFIYNTELQKYSDIKIIT